MTNTVTIKPLPAMSAKEMRWWFEKNVHHEFSVFLQTGYTAERTGGGVDLYPALWKYTGCDLRQHLFEQVLRHLARNINPETSAGLSGMTAFARFGFSDASEASLFKLTFGGS